MKLWSRTAVVVIALMLLALTACSRDRSGDVQEGPADSDAVEVVLQDDEFDPDVLELEAGTEVTVEVRNDGGNQHNFTIDDLNLSTGTVEPGQVVTATFEVPDGTTQYRCTFHPGMDGEIVT
jgi:plastocyanin